MKLGFWIDYYSKRILGKSSDLHLTLGASSFNLIKKIVQNGKLVQSLDLKIVR